LHGLEIEFSEPFLNSNKFIKKAGLSPSSGYPLQIVLLTSWLMQSIFPHTICLGHLVNFEIISTNYFFHHCQALAYLTNLLPTSKAEQGIKEESGYAPKKQWGY
jgi:hypothetical protein